MLKEITVPIDDLLLDPNNPRFVKDLGVAQKVPDDKLEEHQKQTLRLFTERDNDNDGETNTTDISDLYESMTTIGFVPIDRIVVRKIGNTGKYLVIEGNRRISTAKIILENYIKMGPKESRQVRPLLDSLRSITCMLLDTKGLSQEELDSRISIILGLRHHGSLLTWDVLPRAYNIYNEYMNEEPKNDIFEYDNKKAKVVSGRLSISTAEVKQFLRAYIAYLQLCEVFPDVKPHHFSLILYGVTDSHLINGYFTINESTFKLSEESLAKMDQICQFGIRDDSSRQGNKKKILHEPKSFTLLGRLVYMRQRAKHEVMKSYITDLINQVENESDDLDVETALDQAVAFEKRRQWASAVDELLAKRDKELPLCEYTGTGNDRGQKDELKETLKPLRKIMDI